MNDRDGETEEEEEEEGDDNEFIDLVDALDVASKKRKAENEVAAGTDTPRKRRLVEETTEAGAENEFRARSSGILLRYHLLRTFILTSRL
jgi:U3 small nucleolar RNA-associated protein 14